MGKLTWDILLGQSSVNITFKGQGKNKSVRRIKRKAGISEGLEGREPEPIHGRPVLELFLVVHRPHLKPIRIYWPEGSVDTKESTNPTPVVTSSHLQFWSTAAVKESSWS